MGRPKKQTEMTAAAKIENAFWRLLEATDYSKITIQKLADKAGVNRNAVYYHYDNIDDVAQKAFSDFMETEIVEAYIKMLLAYVTTGQEVKIEEKHITCLKKLQVCAGSNSVYINCLLKSEIKKIWFRMIGIDEKTLSEKDKLSVEFALGGILSLLSSREVKTNPYLMLQFSRSDIGRAVLGTMLKIAENKEADK